MTTFDNREQAFENRFVHEEELSFKAEARRNHEVGRWAASLLGRTGEELEVYASSILAVSMEGGGEAVFRKLAEDLRAAEVPVSEHQIRNRMEAELARAREHLGRA